jgi:hypothetical protein
MNAARTQRRGMMLLLAVLLMGISAGLLGLLSMHAVRLHQQRQADRVRAAVRAMSDSGVAYAHVHILPDPDSIQTEPVQLEVAALLGRDMTGSAVVSFPELDGQKVCRVTAKAALGNQIFQLDTDISLPARTEAMASGRGD